MDRSLVEATFFCDCFCPDGEEAYLIIARVPELKDLIADDQQTSPLFRQILGFSQKFHIE
jgi:hypothetical protein